MGRHKKCNHEWQKLETPPKVVNGKEVQEPPVWLCPKCGEMTMFEPVD